MTSPSTAQQTLVGRAQVRPGPLPCLARASSRAAAAVLLLALLAGCAAQRSYREALGLIAASQPEAAMAKLQSAVSSEPDNTEYRTALLLTRQQVLAGWLEQAGRAAAEDRRDAAEQGYRKVLGTDPANRPAQAGLAALERDASHARSLALAERQIGDKQVEPARALVLAVLDENPRHARARALLRQIESRQEPASAELRLGAAFRQPLSLEFHDASIKQAFEAIARTSGLNFIFDKDVKSEQKTALSLKNSTVEAAVQYLLMSNQLEMQVMDATTVVVFPNTAAKLKEYQPLVVKTFVLSSASARSVVDLIKTMVKSRDLVYDEKLNMVFLRDTVEAVRLAEKLVALHDVAEPEVMLEVEILEISRDRLTELGISWPGSLSLSPLVPLNGEFDVLTLKDLGRLRSSNISATIDPLKLNARKVDGDTNLLANPRIRVLNRDKAKIVIGNRVPSVSTTLIATGMATESVTYLDVGLKLDVEPTIYVNGDVTIKIALEVSSIISSQTTAAGSTTYNIGTRSATTTLRLKDGENQVLAGLINDEDRRTANKVPGLGDLPVAGRLFGSTLSDGKKSEIVLSITPRLIRNLQRPSAADAEFYSGTDSSLRSRPNGANPVVSLGEREPPSAAATAATAASAPAAAASAADVAQ